MAGSGGRESLRRPGSAVCLLWSPRRCGGWERRSGVVAEARERGVPPVVAGVVAEGGAFEELAALEPDLGSWASDSRQGAPWWRCAGVPRESLGRNRGSGWLPGASSPALACGACGSWWCWSGVVFFDRVGVGWWSACSWPCEGSVFHDGLIMTARCCSCGGAPLHRLCGQIRW